MKFLFIANFQTGVIYHDFKVILISVCYGTEINDTTT